jgi:hypothetical protein
MKRYLPFALVLILTATPISASAWNLIPQPKDKQFIAETFSNLKGATSDKRPTGSHYQMSMVCTNGFFEIDFFKLTTSGELAILGNITSILIRTQNKGRQNFKTVDLDRDALRVTDSKKLYKWILDQKRIGVFFTMENREEYKAYFDVTGATGLAKKFAGAGCKV